MREADYGSGSGNEHRNVSRGLKAAAFVGLLMVVLRGGQVTTESPGQTFDAPVDTVRTAAQFTVDAVETTVQIGEKAVGIGDKALDKGGDTKEALGDIWSRNW